MKFKGGGSIMKYLFYISSFIFLTTLLGANESKVCQKCHPIIYEEYYKSSHRKASTINNSVHKALWETTHPKVKEGYTCAKCHSPSDLKALNKGILEDNEIQREEPISCVYCHSIKMIDEDDESNTNVLSGKTREFYTAELPKKGKNKASYETKTSWFGLVKESRNSPYHKIDYNNENFYSGNVCMGCHSHVNNKHNFDISMLDAVIGENDKNTCITCHMPQVSGTKVTINETKTHAYHGIAGIYHMNKEMGKYIDFQVNKSKSGFNVRVLNRSNHALFGQSFREGVLDVSIIRDAKEIKLKPFIFTRVLGRDGEELKAKDIFMANETIRDTLVYAKKDIIYSQKLHLGDKLKVTLSVRRLSIMTAKELGLENEVDVVKKRVLKTQTFNF